MNVKKIAVTLCSGLTDRYSSHLDSLKAPLDKSNLKILFRTYVSLMFFSTIVVFFASIPLTTAVYVYNGMEFASALPLAFFTALALGAVAFGILYAYPLERASDRKRNIDANLPFAINHMAAIATSGVPPQIVFRLLAGFGEYDEISKEAADIVRNTETFGQDITTAIAQVAASSPSDDFRQLLLGMLSIIKTGGNLKEYLQVQAREALFIYRIRREEYLQTLSTYADFYTAVLIAAPLFLVSILAVMNLIGGTLAGLTITEAMSLGIYIGIPTMNIIFILFIHATQPEQS